MRRFEPYSIYINHPGRWEATRRGQVDVFSDRRDSRMVNWLNSTGKRLYEITEDRTPGPLARAYEEQVFRLLQRIGSTPVGQLLLCSLNPGVNYWIVPLDEIDERDCECGALTFPGAPKEGGGVRVYFNPDRAYGNATVGLSADDVLFHEMVHAYRNGRIGYQNLNNKPMGLYDSAEEFLALQMQNVYLANRGSHRFYRSYRYRQALSKSSAYAYLADDAEALMAFRYFVDNEPLAKAVAGWTGHPDAFNPWRDQPVLERLYLSESHLQSLPPF